MGQRLKNEILIGPLFALRGAGQASNVGFRAQAGRGPDRGLREVALFGSRLLLVVVAAGVGLVAGSALAQEDLNRGKTPAQLFASDCADCHRNPRSIASRDNVNVLAEFLRVHYTASRESAAAMARYLASLGPEPRAGSARPATRSGPAVSRDQSKSSSTATPAAKSAQPAAPATGPSPVSPASPE